MDWIGLDSIKVIEKKKKERVNFIIYCDLFQQIEIEIEKMAISKPTKKRMNYIILKSKKKTNQTQRLN